MKLPATFAGHTLCFKASVVAEWINHLARDPMVLNGASSSPIVSRKFVPCEGSLRVLRLPPPVEVNSQ